MFGILVAEAMAALDEGLLEVDPGEAGEEERDGDRRARDRELAGDGIGGRCGAEEIAREGQNHFVEEVHAVGDHSEPAQPGPAKAAAGERRGKRKRIDQDEKVERRQPGEHDGNHGQAVGDHVGLRDEGNAERKKQNQGAKQIFGGCTMHLQIS